MNYMETGYDVTPFDARESAANIISEARSIQELLKTYENNTRQLQAEIAEFVVREVAEECKFKEISITVAEAELETLTNGAFLKFAHERRDEDVASEEVMPTQRMRDHMRSKGDTNDCAGNEGQSETQAVLETVQWIPKVETTAMGSWYPKATVALRGYGDVREVLLGWRQKNSKSTEAFLQMSETLYQSNSSSSDPNGALACFCNGALFSSAQRGASFDVVAQVQKGGGVNTVSAAYQSYCNYVTQASSLTEAEFQRELWESPIASGTTTTEGHDNSMLQLLGDAHDTIVLVNSERLQDTQIFRAFFFAGALGALEHIGAQVDLCSLFHTTEPGCKCAAEGLKDQLITTFRRLFASYCDDCAAPFGRNVVMVAAVSVKDKSGASGVILDIRPIAPSLPFHWYLSWGELCAIGQTRPSKTAERTVVFKALWAPVSSLQPYDSLSRLHFPALNAQVFGITPAVAVAAAPSSKEDRRGTAGEEEAMETAAGKTPQAAIPAHYVAAGSLLAMASAAAAAGAWALKRK